MNIRQKLPYGIVILKTNETCLILPLVKFLKKEHKIIHDFLRKSTLRVCNISNYPMILKIKARTNTYFLSIIAFHGTLNTIPNFIELFVRNLNFLRCENWIYLVQHNESKICIYTITYAKEIKEMLKLISVVMFHGLNYQILFLKWNTNSMNILKHFLLGAPPDDIYIGGNLKQIIPLIKRILPKTPQKNNLKNIKKRDDKHDKSLFVSYDGIYEDYDNIVEFVCQQCKFAKKVSSINKK